MNSLLLANLLTVKTINLMLITVSSPRLFFSMSSSENAGVLGPSLRFFVSAFFLTYFLKVFSLHDWYEPKFFQEMETEFKFIQLYTFSIFRQRRIIKGTLIKLQCTTENKIFCV